MFLDALYCYKISCHVLLRIPNPIPNPILKPIPKLQEREKTGYLRFIDFAKKKDSEQGLEQVQNRFRINMHSI